MNFQKISLVSVLLLIFLVPTFAVAVNAQGQSGNPSGTPTSTCITAPGSVFYYSQGFVFNPLNKYTYVYYSSSSSSIVIVLKGTCTLVTTIHFPTQDIYTAAFNPLNGLVYFFINSYPHSTIYLYKGTTFYRNITTISLPGIKVSPFLSLSAGSVFVPTGNGSSTVVPKALVRSVMGNMSGQNSAYSPSTNEVYHINGFSGGDYVRIYGIACSCLKTHLTITGHTGGIVYDTHNSNMYVASYTPTGTRKATGDVTVISTETQKVVTVIGVGRHTMDVSFSPRTGEVYATNLDPFKGATSVSIIRGLSVAQTLAIKGNPDVAGYNPFNGLIYVTLIKANYIAEISA